MQPFLLDSEVVRTTHNKQLETQKPGEKNPEVTYHLAFGKEHAGFRYPAEDIFLFIDEVLVHISHPSFPDDLTFPASFQ